MDTTLDEDKRLENARLWLKRARKDYKAFEKAVGQQYLRSKKNVPEDPALAIYLLQQACEKTVKAVAIASSEFEDEVLVSKYGHDSLMLFTDITLKLLDIPFVEPAWRMLKRDLNKTSKKMSTPREMRNRLHNLKRNIKQYEERPPDTPDWLKEFATLPAEPIRQVVNMLLNLHSKIQSNIFQILEPNLQLDVRKLSDYLEKSDIDSLSQSLAPSFRGRMVQIDTLELVKSMFPLLTGASLDNLLEDVTTKEPLDLRKAKIKLGERSSIEDHFLSVWALCALMFLAAFTFAHESWTRYPRFISSRTKRSEIELDCDSYSADLGIVSCLRDIGKLARITLNDIEQMLEIIAGIFSYFGSSTNPSET